MPELSSSTNWQEGDYILVRNDLTVINGEGPVSTMYVVRNCVRISEIRNEPVHEDETDPSSAWHFSTRADAISHVVTPGHDTVIADGSVSGNTQYYDSTQLDVNTIFNIDDVDYYRQNVSVNRNAFIVKYTGTFLDNQVPRVETSYSVFRASATEPVLEYAQFILTGYTPLATETAIGGFLNINNLDADVEDGGYVYRDSDGHLRLLDYALLREGQLAYQLGQNFETSAALTVEGQQEELDEYVNQRVAFLTATETALRRKAGTDLFTVTVTLNVPEHSDSVVYTIQGIDSRFGTAVVIKMTGYVDSKGSFGSFGNWFDHRSHWIVTLL